MKRGTPDHPKMLRLAEALNVPIYAAIGLMESLWHWAVRYAPEGDIGRWSDSAIARGIGWDGDPESLTRAMHTAGWFDEDKTHRYVIHDWREHCDDATHLVLARAQRYFHDGARPNLTRLSKRERLKITRAYSAQEKCAFKTHGVATENAPTHALPRPAPPRPAPVKESGSPRASKSRRKGKAPSPRDSGIELPPTLSTARFRAAWNLWATHRDEIKKPLTPASVKMQISQFEGMGHDRAIAAIEHTIAKGWQGIREPDPPGKSRTPTQNSAGETWTQRMERETRERLDREEAMGRSA